MRGRSASRGATLVEYSLIFSLLVVLAMGAIQFLNDRSDAEINNQADCISNRPAPAGCAYAAVPSDISVPDPGFSPPTSAPPNAADVPEFNIIPPGYHDTTTGWAVLLDVELIQPSETDPPTPDEPVSGVRIRAEITLRDPANAAQDLPERGYTDCITGANGRCTLRYQVPYDDVDNVKMRIIGIDTDPAPEIPTSVAEYDKP